MTWYYYTMWLLHGTWHMGLGARYLYQLFAIPSRFYAASMWVFQKYSVNDLTLKLIYFLIV